LAANSLILASIRALWSGWKSRDWTTVSLPLMLTLAKVGAAWGVVPAAGAVVAPAAGALVGLAAGAVVAAAAGALVAAAGALVGLAAGGVVGAGAAGALVGAGACACEQAAITLMATLPKTLYRNKLRRLVRCAVQ
jgi:hypothetical protein